MAIRETLSIILKGGPKNIKRRLLRDILAILLLTSGAILVLVFILGVKSKGHIASALIGKANEQAISHFQSFVEPLASTMVLLGKWGESGLLKLDKSIRLATQFQALMEIHPHIHAISLTDIDGNETRLSHHDNQWLLHQHRKTESVFSRWVDGKSIEERTVRVEDYNPLASAWFIGALTINPEKRFFLTVPYSLESTGEKGITASLL